MSFSNRVGYWDVPISLDRWAHVAVTYDSDSAFNDPTFYVDGTRPFVTQSSAPSGTVDDDSGLSTAIGNRSYEHTRGFGGTIDEVRMASTARSRCWMELEYLNQSGGLVLLP